MKGNGRGSFITLHMSSRRISYMYYGSGRVVLHSLIFTLFIPISSILAQISGGGRGSRKQGRSHVLLRVSQNKIWHRFAPPQRHIYQFQPFFSNSCARKFCNKYAYPAIQLISVGSATRIMSVCVGWPAIASCYLWNIVHQKRFCIN